MASTAGSSNGDVVAPSNINKVVIEESNKLESVVSSTSNSLYFPTEQPFTSTPIAPKKTYINSQAKCICKLNNNDNSNNLYIPAVSVLSFESFDADAKYKFKQNGHAIINKYKGASTLLILDKRLIALVIVLTLYIIGYKIVLIAAPYVNMDNVSLYAHNKFNDILNWLNRKDMTTNLNPLLCGLIVSIISFFIVYFDSHTPGVYPPSPFSPKSKQMYYRHRNNAVHLGYITAITSGVIVSALMYYEL